MKKRLLLCCLCAALLLLSLAACGEKPPPAPETNADGMTRPLPLTDTRVPLTDENGVVVTGADGSPVLVERPKVAEEEGETTQPLASNDWAQTAAQNAQRPFDLYAPGDPAKNSPTDTAEFAQTGRIAWPLARIPAALPVAAQYIDRLDDRETGGLHNLTVYVTQMPYDVFLAYVAKLRQAGLAVEAELLPAQAPPLKPAILTGELDGMTLRLLWTPEKATGFIANFCVQLEGAF
ncbi:MAG: hypothetical protein LBS96_02780 [Oscillospiraceae bacterium]|jgi:predicted small lipoprotein YifL|nr:hypothetical protein [Oscillospiraceae bacterium]